MVWIPRLAQKPGQLAEVLGLLHELMDGKLRRHLGLAMLLVAIGALLSALAPVALKATVDAVTRLPALGHSAQQRIALLAGVAYLAAVCGARVLADLRPLVVESADHRLHSRMTQRFFDHLLGLRLSYLLHRHGGELPHSLELATTGLQLIVGQVVGGILPVVVELTAMAVVLSQLDQAALVAVFIATAAVYLLIFSSSAALLTRHARNVSAASLAIHAQLNDAMQHIEALRCFAAEHGAAAKMHLACIEREQRWLHVNRLRTGTGLAATATFTLSLGVSLVLAGSAVIDGSLSVGGFVLANVYMLQMVRPLELLGSAARDVALSLGLTKPFTDILREPSQDAAKDTATQTPAARCPVGIAIEFDKLCFGYQPEQLVLQGLSLSVPAGCTLGIVGATGSGKSSIGRLLLRLYRPQSGCIRLDGDPIESWPLGALRTRIGLVPQDTALFHDSIANNIRLGRPDASREEVERAARCAQLQDLIATLPDGYDTVVGERGLRLSGGERQRIAIARALLKRPDIYVFDEATSMLDAATEQALMDALQAVTAGCTIILIAHRLRTVMHADEIVVLDGGQVAERGCHAELVAAGGRYSRLWRQQAHDCD